jgi:hypothetical protein
LTDLGAATEWLRGLQGRVVLGNYGSLRGYQSFMGHDPWTSSTVIVLTNLQSSPDGKSTTNEISKVIISGLSKS